MLDIVAWMHDVLHCSAVTMFATTGNPNQPIVRPTRRPDILLSKDVIYGSTSLDIILCPDLTLEISWRKLQAKYSKPLAEVET
jgi:hypothetical protein